MDTNSFKKKTKDEAPEKEEKVVKSSKDVNDLDNKLLSKDEEIKKLKLQLQEAQKLNKIKKGDIRAEVNRQGDPKLIKCGLDESGKPIWIKANELTDADIKEEEYIETIKANNLKKY